MDKIQQQVEVWQRDRNNKKATIKWRFSTNDARIKLRRLYPTFEI